MLSNAAEDTTEHNETDQKNLTLVQLKALGPLASGEAISQVAKAAGVGRSTIYRWLKDDAAFVAEFNRQKQENLDTIQIELKTMAREAVAVVREIIQDKNAPASVRLRAALAVLQSVGGIQAPEVGSTDAGEIENSWTIQRTEIAKDLYGTMI